MVVFDFSIFVEGFCDFTIFVAQFYTFYEQFFSFLRLQVSTCGGPRVTGDTSVQK